MRVATSLALLAAAAAAAAAAAPGTTPCPSTLGKARKYLTPSEAPAYTAGGPAPPHTAYTAAGYTPGGGTATAAYNGTTAAGYKPAGGRYSGAPSYPPVSGYSTGVPKYHGSGYSSGVLSADTLYYLNGRSPKPTSYNPNRDNPYADGDAGSAYGGDGNHRKATKAPYRTTTKAPYASTTKASYRSTTKAPLTTTTEVLPEPSGPPVATPDPKAPLVFTLRWSAEEDLDLTLLTPTGVAVWRASTTAGGGVKGADVTDKNIAAGKTGVETITFPAGAYPPGVYTLRVVNHTYNTARSSGVCDNGQEVAFTLTAEIGATAYTVTSSTGPTGAINYLPFDGFRGDGFYVATIP